MLTHILKHFAEVCPAPAGSCVSSLHLSESPPLPPRRDRGRLSSPATSGPLPPFCVCSPLVGRRDTRDEIRAYLTTRRCVGRLARFIVQPIHVLLASRSGRRGLRRVCRDLYRVASAQPATPAKPGGPPPLPAVVQWHETPTGLKYAETGRPAAAHRRATGRPRCVHFTGWLVDGKQFDSSRGRKPFGFKLGSGQVIRGWDEGVRGMRVGGKRRLLIPGSARLRPARGTGHDPARRHVDLRHRAAACRRRLTFKPSGHGQQTRPENDHTRF